MNRKLAAAVAAVLVLVAVGAAFVTGVGPAPGGNDASGSDIGTFPTATPTASGGGSGGGSTASGPLSTATPAPDRPAFVFTIDHIEQCGQTCRDVTSTLENNGTARATNVVVYTRVFAGNGTDGDVIWQGKADVGSLAPGETHTETRRVSLSYREGMEVQNNGGWITIQTTVESDQRTVTFAQQRDVA